MFEKVISSSPIVHKDHYGQSNPTKSSTVWFIKQPKLKSVDWCQTNCGVCRLKKDSSLSAKKESQVYVAVTTASQVSFQGTCNIEWCRGYSRKVYIGEALSQGWILLTSILKVATLWLSVYLLLKRVPLPHTSLMNNVTPFPFLNPGNKVRNNNGETPSIIITRGDVYQCGYIQIVYGSHAREHVCLNTCRRGAFKLTHEMYPVT